MALEKDEQAMLRFTNRLLLDGISLAVDSGGIERGMADRLIDFSADEVVRRALARGRDAGVRRVTRSRLSPAGAAAPSAAVSSPSTRP